MAKRKRKIGIKQKIIISDPVHQVMDFGSDSHVRNTLKALIDSTPFQRLRRVSQLGLTSFVFPGATHSRFSHSLGAAYLAFKVTSHLSEQEDEMRSEIVQNQLSIVASALLHDIGHGPFSHSFEHVLGNIVKERNKARSKGKKVSEVRLPMHEEWTAEIILNRKLGIYDALKAAKLIPERVASPFVEDGPKKKYPQYLKQVVSSQIDVDRMDYLLRDAHCAGVAIGKIDVAYLINCLHVIKHDQKNRKNHPHSLGLTSKGIKSYEAYLVARQLMNRSVYFHRKVKVAECMVEMIFDKLIRGAKFFAQRKRAGVLVPTYFLKLSDFLDERGTSRSSVDSFKKDAVGDYIDLTEDNFWTLAKYCSVESDGLLRSLSKKILGRAILPNCLLTSGKEGLAEDVLTAAKLKKGVHYEIVNLESTLYKASKAKGDNVFVENNDGRIHEVSRHSLLISSFKDKPETETVLIVLDERCTDQIEKLLKKIDAAQVCWNR